MLPTKNPRSKQFKYPFPYMGYTCNPKATSICKQISGQSTAYRSCEYLQPTLPLSLSLSIAHTHSQTLPRNIYICVYGTFYTVHEYTPYPPTSHKIYKQVFIYVFNFCGRDAFFPRLRNHETKLKRIIYANIYSIYIPYIEYTIFCECLKKFQNILRAKVTETETKLETFHVMFKIYTSYYKYLLYTI